MDKQYTNKEVFNQRFAEMNEEEAVKIRETTYDNWLEDYEQEIETCQTVIVDLGCGLGNNTFYLLQKGKEVLACDYSEVAIETLQKEAPQAKTCFFDMTKRFPIQDDYTEIVIADLSIHYFPEDTTKQIIQEIKRILKPNGVLLFRVNAVDDFNFIANHENLDDHFIWQPKWKKSKRLFDEESIEYFFQDWKIEKLQKEKIMRYELEKIVYNCAVRKV